MKLVKIRDVRPGQVWKAISRHHSTCKKKRVQIVIGKLTDKYPETCSCDIFGPKGNTTYSPDDCSIVPDENGLIGFLGITHQIDGSRLVEIPRKEKVQVDDIVSFSSALSANPIVSVVIFGGDKNFITLEANGTGRSWDLPVDDKFCHLGVLGVDWEFVNDKLAEVKDET